MNKIKSKTNNIIKNLIITTMILIASLTATFAQTDGSAIIEANLLSQTPDPAQAGDTVTLKFSIENIGWDTSNNLIISLEEGFPFTIIGDNQKNIGKLLTGQNDEYKQVIEFDVKIDSSAKSGTHELTLLIEDQVTKTKKEYEFNVDIESQDGIEIIEIDKSIISPGSQEKLNFKIKNVGTADLEDLTMSLSSQDNVLLPVLADNSYHIDSLKTEEEMIIPFEVIASSTVTADLYSLDLAITYQDSMTGNSKTITTTAGIYIGGSTQFDVVFDEESDGEYVFTIANIGQNDATSVKVSIEDSTNWKTNGRSSEIIGNLNSGDYTTTSFDMITTKGGDLNFKIEYTDTMGLRKIISKQVKMSDIQNNVTMSNNREDNGEMTNKVKGPMGGLATAGAGLANLGKNILVGLIIIGAGIFGYRTFRKRKHSNK